MMGQEAAGQWSLDESEQHINVLELTAGLFGLKSLCKDMKDTAIMLRMDNSIAVAYVNKMGGPKSEACDLWPKKFGTGVSREIFGSQPATYQGSTTASQMACREERVQTKSGA